MSEKVYNYTTDLAVVGRWLTEGRYVECQVGQGFDWEAAFDSPYRAYLSSTAQTKFRTTAHRLVSDEEAAEALRAGKRVEAENRSNRTWKWGLLDVNGFFKRALSVAPLPRDPDRKFRIVEGE